MDSGKKSSKKGKKGAFTPEDREANRALLQEHLADVAAGKLPVKKAAVVKPKKPKKRGGVGGGGKVAPRPAQMARDDGLSSSQDGVDEPAKDTVRVLAPVYVAPVRYGTAGVTKMQRAKKRGTHKAVAAAGRAQAAPVAAYSPTECEVSPDAARSCFGSLLSFTGPATSFGAVVAFLTRTGRIYLDKLEFGRLALTCREFYVVLAPKLFWLNFIGLRFAGQAVPEGFSVLHLYTLLLQSRAHPELRRSLLSGAVDEISLAPSRVLNLYL